VKYSPDFQRDLVQTSVKYLNKCPPANVRINKTWYIHTMEYYSALKRNSVLTPAPARMCPEDNRLSEKDSHENTNVGFIYFYEILMYDSQIPRHWKQNRGYRVWGQGGVENTVSV